MPPAPPFRQLIAHGSRVSELALLRCAVEGKLDKLSQFLVSEQLIDLPPLPNAGRDYDLIWNCIAKAVTDAVSQVVIQDEELFRQLTVYLEETGHADHRQLIVELSLFREQSASSFGLIIGELGQVSKQLSELRSQEHLSPDAQLRTINLFHKQTLELENQLREQLDHETERLWNEMLEEIRRHNFREAFTIGKELKQWLDAQSDKLSSAVRGRAYLFVAQTALFDGSEEVDPSSQFALAKSLFERARTEFGNDISPENRLRLTNFDATLLTVEGRHREALAVLGEATDTQSTTTRLLIHIERGDFEDAELSIRNLALSDKWCDHAILVLAKIGREDRCRSALNWALKNGDGSLQARCRVAYARGTLMRLTGERATGTLSVFTATPSDTKSAEEILLILRPMVDACTARASANDGLDADALTLAYTCCRLLGKLEEGRKYVRLLRTFRPLPLEYAQAVLRGDAEPFNELSSTLRENHTRSFNAHDLALIVDFFNGMHADAALQYADALIARASSAREKETLAQRLYQIAAAVSPDKRESAQSLLLRVVDRESRFVKLLDAELALGRGELESCEQCLSQIDDDSDRLAGCLLTELRAAQGRHSEAAELLADIGRRSCDPSLLKRAARLAFKAKPRRLDIVLRSLEDAVSLVPDDLEVSTNLAFAYVVLHSYANAAVCFARLNRLEPDSLNHLSNLARSYVLANRPEEALKVYDSICAGEAIPLGALCARAQLLADVGRPHDGFRSMDAQRRAHWDDVPFVLVYMNVAYCANEERRAQEAFERLWQLRTEGKLPPNVLEPKTREDLIAFGKGAHERREFCHQQLTGGKLPWLFVEHLLNNVAYWGWRIRTQEMQWYVDTPSNRAAYSVYATNGYAVRASTDGRKSIEKLKCADRGHAVVADLSALITLHRLDLLKHALSYFGRIVIPTSYLSDVVRDAGRLQPNQLSQKTSLTNIKTALERDEITVAETLDSAVEEIVVDEYTDEKRFRLRDVIEVLTSAGRLADTRRDAVLRVAREPPKFEEAGTRLRPSDELTIGLATLKVVAEYEILQALCTVFSKVRISPTDRDELLDELRVYDLKAETRAWHEELWKVLKEDHRFEARTLIHEQRESLESAETEDASFEAEHIKAIDAPLLAIQEGLPLLADDRVCQSIVLNCEKKCPVAFGSDSLVLRLKDQALISESDASRAILALMKWRYRFLWLPPEMVQCIRVTSSRHDLHGVAHYVQECMRDLGLFGDLSRRIRQVQLPFGFFRTGYAPYPSLSLTCGFRSRSIKIGYLS